MTLEQLLSRPHAGSALLAARRFLVQQANAHLWCELRSCHIFGRLVTTKDKVDAFVLLDTLAALLPADEHGTLRMDSALELIAMHGEDRGVLPALLTLSLLDRVGKVGDALPHHFGLLVALGSGLQLMSLYQQLGLAWQGTSEEMVETIAALFVNRVRGA